MTRRILVSLIVLISVLILPYWIYIPVLFLASILLPFFWEGILLVFLIDIMHGSEIGIIPLLLSPLALSVLMILVATLPIKESLRSYV